MKLANEMTAKLIGRVLAEGMSLSDVDIAALLQSDALDGLCEISLILTSDKPDGEKLSEISALIDRRTLSSH